MRAKLISSLEKCFSDQKVPDKTPLGTISMLKNERYSFQICYDMEEPVDAKEIVHLTVESPLAPFITVYKVKEIPSAMPVYRKRYDANYLRTEPGLFPDLLEPLRENDRLPVKNSLSALWFEVDPQGNLPAGTYDVVCRFTTEKGETAQTITASVEIIDALLPKQEMFLTQWFYTDCLLQYYETEAFDEKHWQIIETFMRNYVKYGFNAILTPVLTPELDTYVGGYRPTTQLVSIAKEGDTYTFDFSRLGRWVDLCDKVGIQFLEINHFFSQWGAAACPKVMASVNGKEERIFGWDTPSDGAEYKNFLSQLIPALLFYLKNEKNGADQRCRFHLSDEPNKTQLKQYQKVSEIFLPLVKGYPVMDALSDYEFYEKGLVDCPIPSTGHIQPFLEHQVSGLYTYYCCSQCQDLSNRFFAMPSARNRIIGVQFYKFNIAGFLHWGYNFYNTQYSYAPLNPFLCSDGEGFAPSGDCYSVYPGPHGQPLPSLRQVVFAEALQDLRALKLCEQLCGRETTMKAVEEGIPPITFKQYPKDDAYLLNLRRRINNMIREKIKENPVQ